MFLSDGIVISISLQVEFTESLTMMSGLFAVLLLLVLNGMSHMMVMLSLLCITVSGLCSYHLSLISISWSLQMLQWQYAAALLCLEMCSVLLILRIQIQYGPLSLHIVNTLCVGSSLACHILLSGGFWFLLPGLELLPVAPQFLFSDYLITILLVLTVSTWGSSRIFGYWSCNANLFSHFSSFIDFILDLNMCFRDLAFSQADLTSLFLNSDTVTSLLNLVAFLVIEFLALDLSCSSTYFWYCPSSCASDSD